MKTAVELCGESEEVQSIHKRSMQLLKAIDLYIVKVGLVHPGVAHVVNKVFAKVSK